MEIDWTLFWSAFFAAGFGAVIQDWRKRKHTRLLHYLYLSYRQFYEATGTPTPIDKYFSQANIELIKGFIEVGKDAMERTGVSEDVYKEHAKAHERFLKQLGEKK